MRNSLDIFASYLSEDFYFAILGQKAYSLEEQLMAQFNEGLSPCLGC